MLRSAGQPRSSRTRSPRRKGNPGTTGRPPPAATSRKRQALPAAAGHAEDVECLVELSFGELSVRDMTALDNDLADRLELLERLLRDRRRLLITQVGVERRDDGR